tara:strand:- start:206 stop:343 length:138 start_codon:yes stop_codon:yes gene_type:complete
MAPGSGRLLLQLFAIMRVQLVISIILCFLSVFVPGISAIVMEAIP